MSQPIFRDVAAKQRIADWYEKFLARVPAPVEHRDIETSLGVSHVLLAGDATNPPLVCLHGALASSAHIVSELGPLLDRFYIIAPDIPGQSVRGPQLRPAVRDRSHEKWLLEILDSLDIDSCDFYGVSWGGFIALQTAAFAPARVKHLVLLVPLGFVLGSFWKSLMQAGLPLFLYHLTASPRFLRRFLRSQLTTWDDDWANYMGDALRNYVFAFATIPFVRRKDVRDFRTPTLIIAADNDLSFPGANLIKRAKILLPHAQTHLLKRSRHIPPLTEEFRRDMAEQVTRFLTN